MLNKAGVYLAGSTAALLVFSAAADAQSIDRLRGSIDSQAVSDPLVIAAPSAPGATPARSAPRSTAPSIEPQPAIRQTRASATSPTQSRTTPAATVESATSPVAEEADPFAPVGVRVGTFVLRPSLESGIEYASNPNLAPGGTSSTFSRTTLRVEGESDWLRHGASFNAFYRHSLSVAGASVNEPEAGIEATLRFDLGSDHTLTGDLAWGLAKESATSAVTLPATASSPLVQDFSGGLALARTDGKLRYALRGSFDRNAYGAATLDDGTALSQSDRNTTLWLATGRLGYEVSPALVPFIEAEFGRRLHDDSIDASGYARDATRYALRGGVALDMGEKLSGELAAGWLSEAPDDARLGAVSGLSLKGSLAWSPQRGTTLALEAGTDVEATSTAGETGSLYHTASLAFTRRMRADLTAEARLEAGLRRFSSGATSETTLAGEAGLTWWINRTMALTGRLRHERFNSSAGEATSNSIFVGMKLQR